MVVDEMKYTAALGLVHGETLDEFPKQQGHGRPKKEGRRPHREKMQTAPFVAWDGEGYSTDDGDHHYMLFGNSLGSSVKGESLTWRQCFPLLLEDHGGINVIYGGDYDVFMMTKTMPFPIRKRLYAGLPVKYAGYRMVWYRRKYLLLTETKGQKRSTVLYDVISFFQCSFVNACKEYLGDDETLQAMHQMKLKRDSFTYSDDAVDPYWRSEMDYLVRLMDTLRELLAEVGIKPRGWYGPGAVASALMAQRKMQAHYGHTPNEIVDIAERAYYGGRFEQFKVGKMEKVYEYDIRSAYPAAIVKLPDFSLASWQPWKEGDAISPWGLYNVSWNISSPKLMPNNPLIIGPLPYRTDKGQILFPLKGSNSWYWGVEIKACMEHELPIEFYTIHEGWTPVIPNHQMPFNWVREMYEQRAQMKREGNPAQKALKLGLNSLYGKLAQSTGAKLDHDTGEWTKPRWHNILWAGWITAHTRAKIFSALRENKKSVVAIETDAVFTLAPLENLVLSEALGDWERTDLDTILYIHSGVYYALREGVWRSKSRGVEADGSKSADYWLDIFSKLPQTSVALTLRLRRFGTDIRQPDRFGRWFDHITTTVMPNAFSKRIHFAIMCPVCGASKNRATYLDSHHYLAVPQGAIESDWRESTPYKFPWRKDTPYEWPEVIKGDCIEMEEVTWQ